MSCAVALQVDQHGDEGHLYLVEEAGGVVGLQLFLQHGFQAEGDVGVLAGVAADVGGGQVAHGLLSLAARADELVDVDGAVVQVDFGQVVHVVPQLGLQDVVGQHRVEQGACHACAVVLQDDDVILDVLSHLQALFIFVEGAEEADAAQGFRAVGREGHVPGPAFGIAEAGADEFGLHRLGAGGLRVYREDFRCQQLLNQIADAFLCVNQLVVHGARFYGVENRIFGGIRPVGRRNREQIALDGGLVIGCGKEGARIHPGGRGGGGLPQDAVQQGAELQFGENLAQGFRVRLLAHQGLHVQRDGHVGLDGGQELGEGDLFLVGFHFVSQSALQVLGVRQEVLDVAELGDEFLRGFLAHAGAAGDVVRGVSHQAQHVDDLPGVADVELGLYFLDAHCLETARMFGAVHPHRAPHQLAVVLVRCHHVRGDASPSGLGGQGADDVVGLVAGHFQDGDAVGAYDVLDDGHGEADGLRRLLALGLVLFVGLVAEGGSGRVEGHAYMGGLLLLQHFFERVDKAQHGRGVEALGVDTRVLDERIISAVYQRVSV